ncbi:MAG: alpha-glucan family phosphorylase, partial [Actinomycetota bacterium]
MTAEATDGRLDVAAAARRLAERLPDRLAPLATVAYNYRWSWDPDGPDVFASIDPVRWTAARRNPVRLLHECPAEVLQAAAANDDLVARAGALAAAIAHDVAEAPSVGEGDHPVVFLCAEFAVHSSLPIYAGGLGVLAGDILKEASDRRVPFVGVGLLYRQGYFHQRVDASGRQHEYWAELDPGRIPAALVTTDSGEPLTISVRLRGRDITVQVWRVEVGRVPLFLLDADREENPATDRWITSRLYVGDRGVRLAQYGLLGLGAIRALRAMGIEPRLIHLNEGHAALAALELAAGGSAGAGWEAFEHALHRARDRTVFTTHTPIPAGNETYAPEEIEQAFDAVPGQLGIDPDTFRRLGRVRPEDEDEWFGLTPLGLRVSRSANGVSRRHGHVARSMWRHLYE